MSDQYWADIDRELSDEGEEVSTRTVTCAKCGTRWRIAFYAPEGARDWEIVRCPECSEVITLRV